MGRVSSNSNNSDGNAKAKAQAATRGAQRTLPDSAPRATASCAQTQDELNEPWTVDCVLKFLCKKDKKVVDQLQRTTVVVTKPIVFNDPYYDGKQWTTREFIADGTSDASQKMIEISDDQSCARALDTFYHEIRHQNQPQKWTSAQMEYDAFYKTEEWLIARGLPGNPQLRRKDAKGNIVPDRDAINAYVEREYPVPKKVKGKQPPYPVDKDAKGNTILSNGKSRPPVTGDTFPDPNPPPSDVVETMKPVDPIISPWSCG